MIREFRSPEDRVDVRVAPDIRPCGDCDYDCFAPGAGCPARDDALDLYRLICESDVSYYVLPNYCDYPCARFFAFNERGQGFFRGDADRLARYLGARKKFVAISNTGGENLQRAFRYHVRDGETLDALFLSARKYGRVSLRGDLTDDPAAREALRVFAR